MSEASVREAFLNQARFCDRSGTQLTAAVVRALEKALDRRTATGRRTLDWAGDPRGSGDSVPLRLAGGLHALARRSVDPRLSDLYRGNLADADTIVADALRRFDKDLLPWLDSPPQTNETGRAGPIMAGMLFLADRFRLPFELIELGASAGLNLNLDRFAYELGGTSAGDPMSPVQLAPCWQGAAPPSAEVRLVSRVGVDQAPIRIEETEARERLMAYCWADQPERMARLQAAIALAADFKPPLEQADAADFAEAYLVRPQDANVARVLYHTIFWTYLPFDKQVRIRASIEQAGESATTDRPIAWLRYELNGEGTEAELRLRSWPDGHDHHLATGHPHGTSVTWHDESG